MSLFSLSATSAFPSLSMTPSGATAASPGQSSAAGSDFAAVLKGLLGGASDTLKQGEAAAVAGVQGSLPIQTVVERMMAAEQTLQTTIGIRDKIVSSYLEISRMQI
jgi:flagellar hook-basal body complex protein FliE